MDDHLGRAQLGRCLAEPGALRYGGTARGDAARYYHRAMVASGGMTATPVKRTLSMRPEVDRMLVAHVASTPGASLSSTVNEALVEYLESAALAAYRQWDAAADEQERAALDAFQAHDPSWAAE